MDLTEVTNIFKSRNDTQTANQESLFDLVFDLWENHSTNLADKYKKTYSYWNGDYSPENPKLSDQTKTACNIVKRIVEVKGSSALDAQFTMNVVPVLNAFADYDHLKEMHDVADIYNSEIHNVLKDNDFDSIKEKIMRRGLICGFAPSQVTWDTFEQVEGRIKLMDIEPENLRWDRNAKRIEDCTFQAYSIELNPMMVKERYARNPDGTYNQDMVEKIDALTEDKGDTTGKKRKGIVNLQTADQASQAYVYDSTGLKSGKACKLVVMFILDDSVYAPSDKDNQDLEAVKEEGGRLYPNGRMIVFSSIESKKVIFDDRPSPEGFRSLGNIDIFKPLDIGEVVGKGEVEDIMPIQDRINGAYAKLRWLIGSHISALLLSDEAKGICKEGEFVSSAVIFLRRIAMLGNQQEIQHITNDNITEAMKLLEYIDKLEIEAYRTARINETTVSGEQAVGTTSAAQVEALQQSPMGSIRSIQRNFKTYCIKVGEKIATLIQKNYSVQRLVKLSTGINGAEYAKFTTSEDGKQRQIELLDRAGKSVNTIKVNPEWKYKVEVSAGTDIPRSRTESAALTTELIKNGVFGDIHDPEVLGLALTELDYPNRRAIVQMAEKKAKEAANQKMTIQTIGANSELSKNFSLIIDSLAKAGMTGSITQILTTLGLEGKADTLSTAPIQAITSKSELPEVVAISAGKGSINPQEDIKQRQVAAAIVDGHIDKNKKLI